MRGRDRACSTSPHPLHGYTTSSWSSGDSGYAPGDSMVLQQTVCVCVCRRRGGGSDNRLQSRDLGESQQSECGRLRYGRNAERWAWCGEQRRQRAEWCKTNLRDLQLCDMRPLAQRRQRQGKRQRQKFAAGRVKTSPGDNPPSRSPEQQQSLPSCLGVVCGKPMAALQGVCRVGSAPTAPRT
jgi:hypothetical protein